MGTNINPISHGKEQAREQSRPSGSMQSKDWNPGLSDSKEATRSFWFSIPYMTSSFALPARSFRYLLSTSHWSWKAVDMQGEKNPGAGAYVSLRRETFARAWITKIMPGND